MTTAVFEAHVRELDRIKALAALQLADVAMLPHISLSSRKDWFRTITKRLLPRLDSSTVLSFNGRVLKGTRQLKRAFKRYVGDKGVA